MALDREFLAVAQYDEAEPRPAGPRSASTRSDSVAMSRSGEVRATTSSPMRQVERSHRQARAAHGQRLFVVSSTAKSTRRAGGDGSRSPRTNSMIVQAYEIGTAKLKPSTDSSLILAVLMRRRGRSSRLISGPPELALVDGPRRLQHVRAQAES